MNEIKCNGKLVDARELLNELFSDECRPSLRWLRTQTKARAIPHVRIGHLVFFDVEMVRAYAVIGSVLAECAGAYGHFLHNQRLPARYKKRSFYIVRATIAI